MSRGCLSGRPYPRDTRETQCELPAKPLQSSVAWVFTLSLSNTQPLQWNLTINTGYKRLNNITIKFGTKFKPTKHNVVNNNFTQTKKFYASNRNHTRKFLEDLLHFMASLPNWTTCPHWRVVFVNTLSLYGPNAQPCPHQHPRPSTQSHHFNLSLFY